MLAVMLVLSATLSTSCPAFSETAPAEGAVSVAVVLGPWGEICIRVWNGTLGPLQHGVYNSYQPDVRLERYKQYYLWADQWEEQPSGLYHAGPAIDRWLRSIPADGFFHAVLDHDARRLPPGRYRVCFRFWQGNEAKRREQCSTPFHLPRQESLSEPEGFSIAPPRDRGASPMLCRGEPLWRPDVHVGP